MANTSRRPKSKDKVNNEFPLGRLNLASSEQNILFAIDNQQEKTTEIAIDFREQDTKPEKGVSELSIAESTEHGELQSSACLEQSLGSISLDEVFQMSADDLETKIENILSSSVRSSTIERDMVGKDARCESTTLPNLRKDVADSAYEDAQIIYDNLPAEYHEPPKAMAAWLASLGQIEWEYMCCASQELRRKGLY